MNDNGHNCVTSRELSALRQELLDGLNDIKLTLRAETAEIKAKQDFTNGRIRTLELWKATTGGAVKAVLLVATTPSILLAILLTIREFTL